MYEADEKIEVIVKDETIWATQKAIAGLFDVGVPAISKHLKLYLRRYHMIMTKIQKTTKMFYTEVQNKFDFAIMGKTEADIVYDKADSKKEHIS